MAALAHLQYTASFYGEVDKINQIIDFLNSSTSTSVPRFTINPGPLLVGTFADDGINLAQFAGRIRVDGQASFADGTVTTPSITFATDTSTGLWHPGTGLLSVTLSGVESGRFTSVGLGLGTSTPVQKLHVEGNTFLDGIVYGNQSVRDLRFVSTNPGTSQFYKIATLPISSSSTQDSLRISAVIGGYTSADKISIDSLFSNRGTLTVNQRTAGSITAFNFAKIFGYNNGTGIDLYVYFPAGSFGIANISIVNTNGVTIYQNSAVTTGSPPGTQVYDATNWALSQHWNSTGALVLTSIDPLAIQALAPNGTSFDLKNSSNGDSFRLGMSTIAGYIETTTSRPLQVATNNVVRMTITAGGNILIGTSSDTGQILQVTGSSVFNGPLSTSSSFSHNLSGNIQLDRDPSLSFQAATKNYVDNSTSGKVNRSGDTMGGTLNMNGNPLQNANGVTTVGNSIMQGIIMTSTLNVNNQTVIGVPTPVNPQDAVNKAYADSASPIKGWITFHSNGSIIRMSGIVNGIVVHGTGNYTVNFNNLGTTNYGVLCMAGATQKLSIGYANQTNSSVDIFTVDSTNTSPLPFDPITVAILF